MRRDEQAASDTWDITVIFRSVSEWQQEHHALQEQIPSFEGFKGSLGESASKLKRALDRLMELNRDFERVYTYAHLASDADTSNAEAFGRLQQALSLYASLRKHTSFLEPELLRIEQGVLDSFLSEEELKPYTRYLKSVIRNRPHTLSEAEERLLSLGTEALSGYGKTFSQLNDADLKFGSVEMADGESKELSHATFLQFLKDESRKIRRQAYEQYYTVYKQHSRVLASLYCHSVKKDIFLARARNFHSCLHAALFEDDVPERIYQLLISVVGESLPAHHEYFHFRKSQLDLDSLALYDVFVPIGSAGRTQIEYEEAVRLVVDSVSPLGSDYMEILSDGLLSQRWVDRYANEGKRSGAYSSGCYDSPPYILLNYQSDSVRDLFTLAHEAGHSMHSYYSRKEQPYQDNRYVIFSAEVASTVHELLLANHLRKHYANDSALTVLLLNQMLDELEGCLFRQTMFAEFELRIHQDAEQGLPITADSIQGVYRELLAKYFGPALFIDELAGLTALRVPHFYAAFYVYKYATGICAAIAIAEGITQGNTELIKRYKQFLSAGCTKFPIELLKDVGIDLSQEDPYRQAISYYMQLVAELKESCNTADAKQNRSRKGVTAVPIRG